MADTFYTSDMDAMPDDARAGRHVDADGVIVERAGDDITVYLDGEDKDADDADPDFDANLAEKLTKQQRARIADDLIAAVEADEQSRSAWKARVDDGLKLLGLEDRSANDEPFPGASSATHPLIGEAIVQFQARALPEIVPSDGPVKATVIGEQSDARDDQAERVADYLNWRLMVDDPEWFDDTDQMLFYLPFGGSAFRKLFTDPVSGRAMSRYIKAEEFIVPYKAKSLADAQRYTHRFDMHAGDIERAIAAGTFVDIDLDDNAEPEANPRLEDVADNREPGDDDRDSTHRIYEVHCYREIAADRYSREHALPYIITVDVTQNDVLAIRRNWDENDEDRAKQVWFAHYKFLPGLGFYGFGFLHLLGGLAKATTGSLRALLDAATRANMQGGYKAKEARNAKGDTTLEPGVYKDIDLTAEELSKAFYTPPFREPSNALFNLLGLLTDAGQRFASTTDTNVGDANNNAPVGTTVALIEQGQKVFSAVHRRIHRAAGAEYRLFAKIDAANLGDAPYPYQPQSGSAGIRASDFDDAIDVVPVSDPNIFSQTQRIALAQEVVKLTAESPDIYGTKEKREAHKRLLKALQVPDIDEILPEGQGATRRDPVTENQYMMVGHPVEAYPRQDHAAHIKLHEAAAAAYANATGQQAQQFQAMMQAHLAEHHAYAYRQRLIAQTHIPLGPGMQPNDQDQPEPLPLEQENEIARAMAMAAPPVPTPAEREAQQQQAEAGADAKRKAAETKAKIQRDQQEAQAKAQRQQAEWQAKMEREQAEWQAKQQREQAGFIADEQRDTAGFEADEQRETAEWQAQQTREQADWEAEQRRKAAEYQAQAARDNEQATRETRQQGAERALANMDRALSGQSADSGTPGNDKKS